MKKALRIFLKALAGIVLIILLIAAAIYGYLKLSERNTLKSMGPEAAILEIGGHQFRDLNKNGRLDTYEDFRKPVDGRVEDLLRQMTLEEKCGLMMHPGTGIGKEGQVVLLPFFTSKYLIDKHINHFNIFTSQAPEIMARWNNTLQKMAERTRLGIPVSIASDPHNAVAGGGGISLAANGFSEWPDQIGLAATGDSALVVEFGRIAAQEYRAVGITTALHPMADLATESRWGRTAGSFGEDADLASKLVKAYIYGFQGDSLGAQSVTCMTKHFPGSGPAKDGWECHFEYGKWQAFPGDNWAFHHRPFEAAIEAHTAQMMTCYGIPTGQTSQDVAASFNREVTGGLLRNRMHFDGVICSDWMVIDGGFAKYLIAPKSWGVENLTAEQRLKMAIDAGVDQFGGESLTELVKKLVDKGEITEDRINQSARRLLRVKFQLGLFENPYVDPEKASQIVGSQAFMEKGREAQAKSLVLLKNDTTDGKAALPLPTGLKIYAEGFDRPMVEKFGEPVARLEEADVAILNLRTPHGPPRSRDFLESLIHQGDLDFKGGTLQHLLDICAQKPTIISIYLERPAVIPEIAASAAGIIANFGATQNIQLSAIFGQINPSGTLPVEMPSSMEAVRAQKEDVPHDSENPLFSFGFGLKYER
jgi:beta-glucosidase